MIETEKSEILSTPSETLKEATKDRVLESALERIARSSLSSASRDVLDIRTEGGGE